MGTTAVELDLLYQARRGVVEVVDVPDLAVLVVDGAVRPEGPEFTDAVETLWSSSRPRSTPTSIDLLHREIAALGLRPHGRHHEIYLSDPRRSRPERLRTILRQPVERA